MIKAVLFDVGGVLLDMSKLNEQAVRLFRAKDTAKFWNELNIAAIPLCKGEMTLAQFWKAMERKHNAHVPIKELLSIWLDNYTNYVKVNKDVVHIKDELRKQYKVGIVSNVFDEHSELVRSLGLYNNLDALILSHEVKMTKDQKEVFLLAAKELRVEPEECVFIDDIQEFCDVAASAGMKTILFKNAIELKSSLKLAGVKLP